MIKKGRGMACMWYGIGQGGPAVAIVKIDLGGIVTLMTGEVDIGQGLNTIFCQMVAEELGVPFETVRIVSTSSSELVTNVGTSQGSRATYVGGNAVQRAAAEAKKKVFEAAAEQLHVAVETLESKDGNIYVKGSSTSIPFAEVTEAVARKSGPIVAVGSWISQVQPMELEHGQGIPFNTYVYATQIADVEVDTETGMVKVVRIVAAHDVGKAINPAFVEGQILGGISFGLGQAIMENMIIVNGRNLNPDFVDYLLPTSIDMPEVKAIIVEESEPSGPFGAKGVGEPPNVATAPAIINAIYNAVGVRITDLPATPAKILKALKEKERNTNYGE